jgi:hypothetical protein
MLFWVWLASGPIKMRKDSAGGRAKTGNRAKSQNAAKQTPAFIEGVRIIQGLKTGHNHLIRVNILQFQ